MSDVFIYFHLVKVVPQYIALNAFFFNLLAVDMSWRGYGRMLACVVLHSGRCW